ncbi:MAG TPA: LuxR C-terminal-related transcriptional regulator [Ktedonobacteraceae bacterium]|nr:LuxR C-terminal-related transcriptional regulator [Ktedonobacteraceae bacterium]
MPRATAYAIIWSPELQRYTLHNRDNEVPSLILRSAEDEARLIEMVDGSSFTFRGIHGHLTLRKEPRRYGEGYWYAYRTQDSRTRKKYVGRTSDITLAALEDIARILTPEPLNALELPVQVEAKPIHAGQTIAAETPALFRGHTSALTPLHNEHPMPLLAQKFHLPRLHASLLARSRLLQQLDSGLQDKLTLLSAPAGFGKTTVVSQWLAELRQRQQHPSVAWVSLDPEDNDPIRFWQYVMTACQEFQPSADTSALALLRSIPRSPLASVSLELLLRTFLNELASLPHRSILILEDYHGIDSPEIHASLTFLLEHMPAQLHLIITTRVDPPLPLARLRARGNLCELRADELRFSQEETTSFLQQVLPAPLSAEEISYLDSRLEGWVTGLRLVTLALQRRVTKPEIERFLTTFSGGQRHLLDFFVTEVLATQPEELQVFLLQTSILSRLSVQLCDAVLEREGSEPFLKTMETANLFLQPLDGSGQWYRYHPLFAEAMQQEARQRFGEEALRLWYSRASRWYEQQQMRSEAIEMALHAQEFARVAALIEQSLRPHYMYQKLNEYYTLQRWLRSLPEDMLGQHPHLCVRVVLLLLFSSWEGRADCSPPVLEQINRLLHKAESAWQAEGNTAGLSELLAVRALISGEQGDMALATRYAREALISLPESSSQWRGGCFRIIGTEEMLAGRVSEARRHLQESLTLFEIAGNRPGGRATLLALAETCWLQGDLRQANEFYRAVVDKAGEDLSDKARALSGLAQLSYEWNSLETAAQEAQEALNIGLRIIDEAIQVRASLLLADIEQARGQLPRAQHRLHELLARLPAGASPQRPLLLRSILAEQARLSLAAGDLEAVERWSLASRTQGEGLPRLQQEREELLTLRLLLTRAETEEVTRQLEPWQIRAQEQGQTHRKVELLLLLARASFIQDNRLQALSLLKEALMLARTENYQRLFLDEGDEIAVLLRNTLPTLKDEPAEAYAQKLLQAFSSQPLPKGLSPASNIFVSSSHAEPLSPQEQRVFRLLAAGCSNREIAEALVVSINTVKTQVRSIYQKLHIQSRKDIRLILRGRPSP